MVNWVESLELKRLTFSRSHGLCLHVLFGFILGSFCFECHRLRIYCCLGMWSVLLATLYDMIIVYLFDFWTFRYKYFSTGEGGNEWSMVLAFVAMWILSKRFIGNVCVKWFVKGGWTFFHLLFLDFLFFLECYESIGEFSFSKMVLRSWRLLLWNTLNRYQM